MNTILIPYGYGLNFNVPRTFADRIRRTRYAPLYRLSRPLESVAVYWPFQDGFVLHSMNAVPLFSAKPWVVSFESRLPRLFGNRAGILEQVLRQRLLTRNCLGLIAMSKWAAELFVHYNSDWEHLSAALRKFRVLHPTVPIRSRDIRKLSKGEALRLVFVGNQIARKGGIVALRVAKRAAERKLPIKLDIISGMQYGPGNHCDYPDRKAYADDMRLLTSLPNVTFHGSCDNGIVLQLMRQAHLTFLASLHETYGFSIIEGFSCATPAITANVCAQSEINAEDRGIVLHLPADKLNCWTGMPKKGSPPSWDLLDSTYNSLADQAFEALSAIVDSPETIERLSAGAIRAAETRHNPEVAAALLNEIYSGAKLQ